MRGDWSKVRAKVEKALKYTGGLWSFDDLLRAIDSGTFQVWWYKDSVAVTEIQVFPQGKVFNIFLVAGRMQDMRVIERMMVEAARLYECDRITITGREGWLRSFLLKAGWSVDPVVNMTKGV